MRLHTVPFQYVPLLPGAGQAAERCGKPEGSGCAALSERREGLHQEGLLPVEPVVDEQPLVLHARRGAGEVWLTSAGAVLPRADDYPLRFQ